MQTEEGGEALLRGSMLRCTAAVYISFRVLRLHTKQRTTVHFECWQRITRTITCLIFVRSMMFFDPIVFCEHARKKLAEYKKKKVSWQNTSVGVIMFWHTRMPVRLQAEKKSKHAAENRRHRVFTTHGSIHASTCYKACIIESRTYFPW